MKYGHVFFTVQTRVSTDRHHQEAPLLRLCFCDSDAIVQDCQKLLTYLLSSLISGQTFPHHRGSEDGKVAIYNKADVH